MVADLSEVRRRAWETRRRVYGPRGYSARAYRRGHCCSACMPMRDALVGLHAEGVLSEGQVARITGLDRVEVRMLAEPLLAQMSHVEHSEAAP